MINKNKIEELLDSAEKKIHAGEWIRVDIVRRLLAEAMIWAYKDLAKSIKEDTLGEEE